VEVNRVQEEPIMTPQQSGL